MADEIKEIWANMNRVVFIICLTISIALIVASWFVPPRSVIDSSVLAAVGEIFAYPVLLTVILGIEKGHKVTMQKGNTSLTINKDEEKKDLNEEYDT